MRPSHQTIPISPLFSSTATKTTTYTAQIGELVPLDPSGAGFTVNLAAITATNKNGIIWLKNITNSTNTITVDPNSAQTVDGAATFAMNTAYQSLILVSDGVSNWLSFTPTSSAAGIFAAPEVWTQIDIPANQADTDMSAQVSQLFDTVQAIRAGSIVGINIRFSANLAGGSATATITVNGTPGTLAVTVSSGSGSGRTVQAAGIDSYVAGDLLGVVLSTDSGFLPDADLDAEVWLELA